MWGSTAVDDDDAPPPGFGPNRFEQMMQYNPGRIQPGADLRPAQQYSTPTYQQQYGAGQQQQQQQPASSWQVQPEYQSSKYPPSQGHPAAPGRGYIAGPAGVSVGAVRHFQRALSNSLSERQESAAANTGRNRAAAQQSSSSPTPDYGEYNDDDDEYGASSTSRRSRQGPSHNPARKTSSANNLTSSHNNSYGNLSVASTHSHPSQRSQTSPLPRHASSPKSATADSARKQVPHQQPQHQQQPPQQHQQSSRTPTPDYGEYEDADDYGSRPSSKAGSRWRTGSAAAGDPAAVAAASQALAGIPTPGKKQVRRVRRAGKKDTGPPAAAAGAGGHVKLSAERTAQLEAELAALRHALAEAEAREMEAQMAVVHLATDNTTLQAQLEGMRTQKQQLETMLLFGGTGSETSQAGDEYEPYACDDGEGGYSDECEDEERAPEQQQTQALPQQHVRQSWADEMDDQEGSGQQQQQQQTARSWVLPDYGMAPGAADVLEAEEELRRLGLLPDSHSDATAATTAVVAAPKQPPDVTDAGSLTDSTAAAAVAAAEADKEPTPAAGQPNASAEELETEEALCRLGLLPDSQSSAAPAEMAAEGNIAAAAAGAEPA